GYSATFFRACSLYLLATNRILRGFVGWNSISSPISLCWQSWQSSLAIRGLRFTDSAFSSACSRRRWRKLGAAAEARALGRQEFMADHQANVPQVLIGTLLAIGLSI